MACVIASMAPGASFAAVLFERGVVDGNSNVAGVPNWAKTLKARGVATGSIINFSAGGFEIRDVRRAYLRGVAQLRPDLVIVLIGTNDLRPAVLGQGDWRVTVDAAFDRYEAMMDEFLHRTADAHTEFLPVMPPPLGALPFEVRAHERFRKLTFFATLHRRVTFLDAATRLAGDDGILDEALRRGPADFRLNIAGHKVLWDAMAEALLTGRSIRRLAAASMPKLASAGLSDTLDAAAGDRLGALAMAPASLGLQPIVEPANLARKALGAFLIAVALERRCGRALPRAGPYSVSTASSM